MQDLKQQISGRLRDFCAKRNLTQQKVSDLSGLSLSHVRFMYQGRGYASALGLYKLARGIGISIDWLLGIEDKKEDGNGEEQP